MDDLTPEQARLLDNYIKRLSERSDLSNLYVRVGRVMTPAYASLVDWRDGPGESPGALSGRTNQTSEGSPAAEALARPNGLDPAPCHENNNTPESGAR